MWEVLADNDGSAGGYHLGNEPVSVGMGAFQGDEQGTGTGLTGVRLQIVDYPFPGSVNGPDAHLIYYFLELGHSPFGRCLVELNKYGFFLLKSRARRQALRSNLTAAFCHYMDVHALERVKRVLQTHSFHIRYGIRILRRGACRCMGTDRSPVSLPRGIGRSHSCG